MLNDVTNAETQKAETRNGGKRNCTNAETRKERDDGRDDRSFREREGRDELDAWYSIGPKRKVKT